MSITHQSKVSTDGLVLYYDKANTRKSWKGAPTTNLFGGKIRTAPDLRTGPDGSLYKGWASVGTGGADQPRVYTFAGGDSTGIIPIEASTFYGFSCLYWSSDDKIDDVYLQFAGTGWPEGTVYHQPLTSGATASRNGNLSIIDLGDGWKDCSATFETTADTTALNRMFYDVDARGVQVFITDIQLEKLTYTTPYVANTRGMTEAIVDLVGVSTFTSNGLVYGSGNEFSFDGVNSGIYVPFNSAFDFDNEQTIIIILNKSASGDARQNPYHQAYSGGGTITVETNNQINYFFGNLGTNGGSGGVAYSSLRTEFSLIPGEVTMIGVTRNAEQVTWYKNGIATNFRENQFPSSTVTGTYPINIGQGYAGKLSGDLSLIQVYTRALSADEMAQNFNALRATHGL
jgi:hypothetical protein